MIADNGDLAVLEHEGLQVVEEVFHRQEEDGEVGRVWDVEVFFLDVLGKGKKADTKLFLARFDPFLVAFLPGGVVGEGKKLVTYLKTLKGKKEAAADVKG